MAAEDALFKIAQQPKLGQHHLHLESVGAGGTGNAATVPGMDTVYRISHMRNGSEVARQRSVTPGTKAGQPGFGHRRAGFLLDQRRLIADRFADKLQHAFIYREPPTALGQHLAQHAIGEGFAVGQHAVAVKQHGVKVWRTHALLPLHALHCRSLSVDFLRRAGLADKNRCWSGAVNMGAFRYQAKAR